MGYPLPPAPWNGEYRYLIVAIPDADEYARAAYDAYNQLSNAWAWGKEGVEPLSYDAHQAWLQAIAETWRLLEMGWPDDMLAAVDEVESLLEALQFVAGCCDSTDPSGGTLYTDTVTDGVGDVPQNVIDAGYATGISDWAGFSDYKCMIAHVLIDDLEAKMRKLAPYVDVAGKIVGGVATVVGIITTIFSGGLTALAGGILAVTGAASTIYGSITSASALTALADDVAANHDALACAFYQSDGVDQAVANLNAEIDSLFSVAESTLLKAFNYEPTARALYEGRYDAANIAQTLADAGYQVSAYDCSCVGAVEAPEGLRFDIIRFEYAFGDTRLYALEDGGASPFQTNQVYFGSVYSHPVGETYALGTAAALAATADDNEATVTLGADPHDTFKLGWKNESSSTHNIDCTMRILSVWDGSQWVAVNTVEIVGQSGAGYWEVQNGNELRLPLEGQPAGGWSQVSFKVTSSG